MSLNKHAISIHERQLDGPIRTRDSRAEQAAARRPKDEIERPVAGSRNLMAACGTEARIGMRGETLSYVLCQPAIGPTTSIQHRHSGSGPSVPQSMKARRCRLRKVARTRVRHDVCTAGNHADAFPLIEQTGVQDEHRAVIQHVGRRPRDPKRLEPARWAADTDAVSVPHLEIIPKTDLSCLRVFPGLVESSL